MKKVAKKENIKFKENVIYSASEMKRYLGALNEIHGGNLKGIKEGFDILNRKFDLNEKILNSHTEMIGVLMEDMTIVKEDLSTIKGSLKKKVDYDDFLSLVRRVQKIEAKI